MTYVGLKGITVYWGVRSLVRDLPRDFIARIESGLDAGSRRSLQEGLETVQNVARLQKVALLMLLLGFAAIVLGSVATAWVEVRPYLPQLVLGLWLSSGALFVGSLILHGARYQEVRHLESFVKAMRLSSLARDLG